MTAGRTIMLPLVYWQVVGPARSLLLLAAVVALGKVLVGLLVCLLVPSVWLPDAYLSPWLLLSFGGVALWALRSWPGWSALLAIVGAAYADGPLERAGVASIAIEAATPAVLWLAAVEQPQPLLGWRRRLVQSAAWASLAVCALSMVGIWTRDVSWFAIVALSLPALVVLLCRARGRLRDSMVAALALGALPAALYLVVWYLTGATSTFSYAAPNVVLALVPLSLAWMLTRRRRDHADG